VNDSLPRDSPVIRHRPFRAPHHTISFAGLIGGGRFPHPSVVFLDELPEFDACSMEGLRQPLEDKIVNVTSSALAHLPRQFSIHWRNESVYMRLLW
jgi:magnesium chelatase family protein